MFSSLPTCLDSPDLTAPRSGDKGQQRHMARALHRNRDAALVTRTGSGAATRQDLTAIRDVSLQSLQILIIGCMDLVSAEHTHLATRRVATASTNLWTSTFTSVRTYGRACAAAFIVASASFFCIFVSHECFLRVPLLEWNVFFTKIKCFARWVIAGARSIVI
jgi:hypothetical protein